MSENISSIDLEISSSSSKAIESIEALIGKLDKLKNSLENNINVTSPVNNLTKLNNAINGITSSAISKVNSLAQSLNNLSQVGNVKISSSIARQITSITESLETVNPSNFQKVSSLANAVNALGGINTGKGAGSASTVGGTITRIVKGLKDLESLDLKGSTTENIKDLIKSLEPLTKMDKSNLGSTLTQLRKIPETFKVLKTVDLKDFDSTLKAITNSLKPLSTELDKVGNQFNKLPSNVNKASNAVNVMSKNVGTTSLSKAFNLAALYWSLNRIGYVVGGFLDKSNQYIEDLNLFTASMGKYAKESKKYAETVGELMGLDPAEFMRNQGIFMTLATGFGIANDRAAKMSKNLTQLGYDISSFFNIDYKDAMLKLQSGLAGELEPLRRIGYDLSKAKLEANALSLGITKSYNDMTQAEKAALRYHAIMTQVTTVQGDMARTLLAPSNQLRVLKSQFEQLARAIGNIFIPALNLVLPYIIMVVKAFRFLMDQLASITGFELPKVDYSGLNPVVNTIDDMAKGTDNLSDGMKKARKEAEKYKNTVMGFDELNILNDVNNRDYADKSKKKKDKGIGGIENVPVPEYDFLKGLVDNNLKKLEKKLKPFLNWLKDNFDYILRIVLAIGAGIGMWKLATFISNLGGAAGLLSKISEFFTKNKFPIGLSLMVTGITLSALSGYSIGYNGFNWRDMLTMLLGNALTIAGSLLALGTGPAGWIVGIGLSFAVNLISIALGKHAKLRDDDLKARFGNINLSDEEAFAWAREITATMEVRNAEVYFNERETLITMRGDLQKIIDDVNRDNKKIALGIEVNFEEYKNNIEQFVVKSQEYLDQNYLTTKILLDGEFGRTETGKRLSEFVEGVYGENKLKLAKLGDNLRSAVAESFKDGEWVPDKVKEAQKIQEEISQILNEVSHIDFQAKIRAIQMDFVAADLTPEAFQKMQKELDDSVKEREQDLSEIRLKRLGLVFNEYETNIKNKMPKEKALKIKEEAESEIENYYRKEVLEIRGASVNWQLAGIEEYFKKELEQIAPTLNMTATEMLLDIFPDGVPKDILNNIDTLTYFMGNYLNNKFSEIDISNVGRENLNNLLSALAPTMVQLEELRSKYLNLGQKVPDSINEALLKYENLRKVGGAIDTNLTLIGAKFSQDGVEGRKALRQIMDFANQVPDEFKRGLELGSPEVTKGVADTFNKLESTVGEYKSIVEYEAFFAGKSIPKKIKEGIKGGVGFGSAINDIWSDIEKNWNNTKKDLSVNFGINVKEKYEYVASGVTNYTGVQLKQFATGGFPQMGEVFIARESGPEMVGMIGSKPAVANENQIVTAVSTGVAQAVSQTLGSNQSGDIVLVIQNPNEVTGKEIYRQNIAKARREGGR